MINEELRIVFMGTPEFAVTCLKHIVESDYNVVGVITAPDKPAGRGRKLNESAVKKFAVEKNLKILQPTNLKDEGFLKELSDLNANLQVVVAFRMLPKQVWQLPKFGTFNLHASLLPQYRGAAPIHWAIINGETKTGLTTFFIDDKIDTGEMILQESMEIEKDETVGQLHDRMMEVGARLIVKTIEQIKTGSVNLKTQSNSGELNTAYKLNRDNTKINWNSSIDTVYNQIRGLNPFPTAWTEIKNGEDILTAKIYDVIKELASHSYNVGQLIVNKEGMKIAVENGFIHILELQLPGKRKMDVKALINGFDFKDEAKVL